MEGRVEAVRLLQVREDVQRRRQMFSYWLWS